jgi:hypothetical protein
MNVTNLSRHFRSACRASTVVYFFLGIAVMAGSLRAQYTALYAFGDSLSDLGNTYNALVNLGQSDPNIYNLMSL